MGMIFHLMIDDYIHICDHVMFGDLPKWCEMNQCVMSCYAFCYGGVAFVSCNVFQGWSLPPQVVTNIAKSFAILSFGSSFMHGRFDDIK